jgi:hypothetical protein
LYDANGPLWYRDYVLAKAVESDIDETLRRFNAKRIVIGHTLVNTVRMIYGGRVIAIDTRHNDPYSTALLVEDGKFFRIDQNGKRGAM